MKLSKDILTVVEMVYLQPIDGEAQCVESRYMRELDTHEQLYKRRMTVTNEWKPLDVGWIEKAGLLVIHNEEGQHLTANPTEEEAKTIADSIVEISSNSEGCFRILVRPGESTRFEPSDVFKLQIRSRTAKAFVTIHAFPN